MSEFQVGGSLKRPGGGGDWEQIAGRSVWLLSPEAVEGNPKTDLSEDSLYAFYLKAGLAVYGRNR